MSGLALLLARAGNWRGLYQLWLTPADEGRESRATATVVPLLGGRFVRLDYTWAFDGELQAGSLTFGHEAGTNTATAVWIDGWHMGNQFMICTGSVAEDGAITVLGSYAAPPGPAWGWRTEIASLDDERFRLRMINITPEGEEALAVEVVFKPDL